MQMNEPYSYWLNAKIPDWRVGTPAILSKIYKATKTLGTTNFRLRRPQEQNANPKTQIPNTNPKPTSGYNAKANPETQIYLKPKTKTRNPQTLNQFQTTMSLG